MPETRDVPVQHDNEYETLHIEDGNVIVENDAGNVQTTELELERAIPGCWISKNDDILYRIYNDVKEQSGYSSLLDKVDYARFCEYMEHVYFNDTKDEHEWNWDVVDEFYLKSPNKTQPNFKRWVRHFLHELYSLHTYLCRIYALNFGGFEIFMDFVYDNSSSKSRLPAV